MDNNYINWSSDSENEEAIKLSLQDFPLLKTVTIKNQKKALLVSFKPQRYYRIIESTGNQNGLESFYGEDRSFCAGQIFDSSDFIIEFKFIKSPQIFDILHYQQSYRGSLRLHEILITGIFYRNPPLEFNNDFFIDQLKSIYDQVEPGTFFYEVQSYPDVNIAKLRQISQKSNN